LGSHPNLSKSRSSWARKNFNWFYYFINIVRFIDKGHNLHSLQSVAAYYDLIKFSKNILIASISFEDSA